MSTSRSSTSTTPRKANRKPCGGKAKEIAAEMERKRKKVPSRKAKTNTPAEVPHWHKYVKDDGDREGTIEDVQNMSDAIPSIMRFHRLDHIVERIIGYKLKGNRFTRILDDGRTIELCEHNNGLIHPIYLAGVLPEGYRSTCVDKYRHYPHLAGYWVGTVKDIEELERLVILAEKAMEAVHDWLCCGRGESC